MDKDALDILPPVYQDKKFGNIYPLGAMSPQLKFQLLLLVKEAMDFEKEDTERERQEKERNRHARV